MTVHVLVEKESVMLDLVSVSDLDKAVGIKRAHPVDLVSVSALEKVVGVDGAAVVDLVSVPDFENLAVVEGPPPPFVDLLYFSDLENVFVGVHRCVKAKTGQIVILLTIFVNKGTSDCFVNLCPILIIFRILVSNDRVHLSHHFGRNVCVTIDTKYLNY